MFLLISGGHVGAPKRCTNQWRLHTKLYRGAWNVSANNSETVGHKDPRLGQIVYKLVFYNISSSWLVLLNGFQLNFLLNDSENDLYLSFAIFKRNCRIRSIFVTCPCAESASVIQNGVFTHPCNHAFAVQTFWRPNFQSHRLKILPLGTG